VSQPITSPPSVAAVPTHRPRAGSRGLRLLVTSWQSVAGALVCAEAHNREVDSLFTQLGLIEAAIQERYPLAWASLERALLAAVLRWSHDGLPATAGLCLVCRRVAAGLPLDLPLPVQRSAR
jgi:hypothetical protein